MSLCCQRLVVRELVREPATPKPEENPAGRVLHQPQPSPQITTNCLAHVRVFDRQLPETIDIAADGR